MIQLARGSARYYNDMAPRVEAADLLVANQLVAGFLPL